MLLYHISWNIYVLIQKKKKSNLNSISPSLQNIFQGNDQIITKLLTSESPDNDEKNMDCSRGSEGDE